MSGYTPKCPHCGSTNVKAISHFLRGASSIFSPRKLFDGVNKNWHCNSCKKDF